MTTIDVTTRTRARVGRDRRHLPDGRATRRHRVRRHGGDHRRGRGRARGRPRPRRHVRGRGLRGHAGHRLPGAGRARGAGRAGRHPAPDLLRPGRAGPSRRRHRARRDHAPVPDGDAGVPVPRRRPRRRGGPPPGGRRGHRDRHQRRFRLAVAHDDRGAGRRRAARVRPQGLLQPVARGDRGGDLGRDRRAGRRRRGGALLGAAGRRGRHHRRDVGHARHARHGEPRPGARGRGGPARQDLAPAGRTASWARR